MRRLRVSPAYKSVELWLKLGERRDVWKIVRFWVNNSRRMRPSEEIIRKRRSI